MSAQYADPTHAFAALPPINHMPKGSRGVCPSVDGVTEAMLAGANYANNVCAQVVDGHTVSSPPVSPLTPADKGKAGEPLVNWYGFPTEAPTAQWTSLASGMRNQLRSPILLRLRSV